MTATIFTFLALASCVWALRFEAKEKRTRNLIRRVNGQVARKIPVTINGELVEYLYR